MRINKLFTFGLAALAFAACSNDDEPGAGANGEKGELVDAISIKFESGVNTRADNGTIEGVGTENDVYVAYVFAHEIKPTRPGAVLGEWTVQRVVANEADATKPDAEVTTAIGATAVTGRPKLTEMATFNGVQLGENVYVIVNDPNMTLDKAYMLAHDATAPEAKIKAYVSAVEKTELSKLTFKDGEQKGRFTMAGVGAIKSIPNIPNGTTTPVLVELNRELAKVKFTAEVTIDDTKEAYKRVELHAGDGLVVVRIPNRVSFFTTQEADWYFPKISSDATAELDWTASWLNVFDGYNKINPTDVEIAHAKLGFNTLAPVGTAREFRFTWATEALNPATNPIVLQDVDGKNVLVSPFFYVTPNYSGDAGRATVVCTQATYIGGPAFVDANAQKVFTACYDLYAAADATNIFRVGKVATGAIIKQNELGWTKAHLTAANTYLVDANKQAVMDATGLEDTDVVAAMGIINAVLEINVENAALSFYQGMKRFYRADIADYDAATNTISAINTERNTYYETSATINSLGAPTISDAINSDDINMIVSVKVKDWSWKVNKPGM